MLKTIFATLLSGLLGGGLGVFLCIFVSVLFPRFLPFLNKLLGGSHRWPSVAEATLLVALMMVMALLGVVIGAWLGFRGIQ